MTHRLSIPALILAMLLTGQQTRPVIIAKPGQASPCQAGEAVPSVSPPGFYRVAVC